MVLVFVLLSAYVPIQNEASDFTDLETLPSVKFTGPNPPQIASFNGSIPAPDRLYTTELDLDHLDCLSSSQNHNIPYYQDYAQASDGSYFVLASSPTNGILKNGNTTSTYDALLMHFDANGNCLNSNSYSQISTETLPWAASTTLRPSENSKWHNTGAQTLVVLDEDWLVVVGVLGYERYPFSSWGDVINNTNIPSNSLPSSENSCAFNTSLLFTICAIPPMAVSQSPPIV